LFGSAIGVFSSALYQVSGVHLSAG
jgi:hypothetical protein